jgi:hypothetical protein
MRSPRFWLIFTAVILGAAGIAYGIAYWATNTMPPMAAQGSEGTVSGSSHQSKIPAGPKSNDFGLGKNKELDRN